MNRKLSRLLVNGVIVLLSSAIALLAVEGFLRAIGFEYNTLLQKRYEGEPGVPDNRSAGHFTVVLSTFEEFEYDPELFWRPRPNVSVFNSLGLRGPEWGPKEPGDPLRVVTVGDSNTLGFIDGDAAHWPGFLQDHFNQKDLQIVNAGVYGYTSHQGLRRFKSILALEPDFVTLSFGANDAHQRGFDDRQYSERIAPFMPFESWKIDDLLLLAYDAILPLPDYDNRRPRVSAAHYKENLKEMLSLCREHGIECLLLTRPFYPEHPLVLRALKADPLSFINYMAGYNAVVREVAGETGAALMDVAAYFENKHLLFTDSNHFTIMGQRMMADLMAAEIKEVFPELRRVRRALYLKLDMTSFDGMHPNAEIPNWSKGTLRIDLAKLTMRPSDRHLILRTRGWREFDAPEEIGLKLSLDGKALRFVEKKEKELVFLLPEGQRTADEITLTVDTFVPSEILPDSTDDRALGLDVLGVRFE